MNLKIEKDLRLRISKEELDEFLQKQSYQFEFNLTSKLVFTICLKLTAQDSYLIEEEKRILVYLNQNDCALLRSPSHQKKGLVLNNLNIQCDLHSKKIN